MEEEQWTKTKPIYVKVGLFRKLLLGFVTIKQTYNKETYFTKWYPKCVIKADYLHQTPSSKKEDYA